MQHRRHLLTTIIALLLAVISKAPQVNADDRTQLEFFEKRIRPVLIERCYQCHSALSKEVKGGLQVDHRQGLRAGGESGAAIVPGRPNESLLLSALRHEDLKMPPDERLPARVIADFEAWIAAGAIDPRETPASPAQAIERAKAAQWDQLSQWWSFQRIDADLPTKSLEPAANAARIDEFIRQRLVEQHLSQAPRADRRTLIRRLSFALTGLPPSAEEVSAFVADEQADAWLQLVERKLNSPHFGERWARHWMDVVRYSDTYGYEWDIPAKGAWRYRDYLTRAFNQDVSFQQLVLEHIAGDQLEQPRLNPSDAINESMIGTMFFQMGEKRHGDSSEFDGIHQEMLDNKIDAFSKTFQGLTISCARCHDHKIDPILQEEYYALGGIFMSSRWVSNTVDLPTRHEQLRRELSAIKAELRPLLTQLWLADLKRLDATRLDQLAKSFGDKAPPVEEPLHAWWKIRKAAAGESAADLWKALTAIYQAEREKRTRENGGHFSLVADFRKGVPTGWSVDGVGVDHIVPCGDFTVSLEGAGVIGQVLHGGLVTHAHSPRMNGAVRTPWLNTLEPGHLSVELAGGDFATRRAVIDNAFLTEKQQYINNKHPQWVRLDTFGGMRERHIYLEFATKTSNPNFPPRVGLGGACSEVQAADPRSWFAISRVMRHQAPFTPFDELTQFNGLVEGDAPTSPDAVADRYGRWLRASLDAWSADRATDDDVRLINWMLDVGVLTNSVAKDAIDEVQRALLESVSRYRTLERDLPEPWTVNGMRDVDTAFEYPLHERGDYDKLGAPIPRGYLRLLSSAKSDSHQIRDARSGRLELARRIASNSNPLTARVFVNRVWQALFGTGLVATTNDFGHLGERPSHPELLDHLARQFMADGWSTKRLVRAIALSDTWQQGGAINEAAQTADPANRLLHHFPLRRLEAEAIRDAMLATSGQLDLTLYGPPINPHRQNEDDQKRLFSGPLNGAGRRSIYTKLTIMEPPRLLALFNQPAPKIPTGTRDVTNTPAQSLALLNDPFVKQQAEAWTRSLMTDQQVAIAARIESMFVAAYGRPPTATELNRWDVSIQELARLHNVDAKAVMQSETVWQDAAHAIFNTKEFIYLR